MKKISIFLTLIISILICGNVNAKILPKEEIPAGSYVIGTHVFNRDSGNDYNGTLTIKHIMLAAKTISGNSVSDMQIYYKNSRGNWVDALTSQTITTPSSFEVKHINGDTIKCTVTFDSAGGSSVTTQNITEGSLATEPNEPTKTGYTFTGWTLNEDEYDFNTSVTQNISLTATWSANTYAITYDSNGGGDFEGKEVTYGSPYGELPTPTKELHQFAGWYTSETDENGSGTLITSADDVLATTNQELHAKWLTRYMVCNSYQKLNEQYGVVKWDECVTHYAEAGTSISISPSSITPPPGFRLNTYGLSNQIVTADGGLIIYITLMRNFYNIDYYFERHLSKSFTDTYYYEEQIVLPEEPTKIGYTFVRWVDSENNPYVFSTMPAGSFRLYAEWTPQEYDITYDLDGGSIEEDANPSTYTLATQTIILENPIKEGYNFAGWKDSDDTTVNRIYQGTTGDISLRATWTVKNYVIGYDMKGGTFNPESDIDIMYNIESATIVLLEPTKTGYNFAGWENEAGDIVTTIPAGSTGDMSLTATWTGVEYNITYDTNGGEELLGKTVTYGSPYGELPTPTRTNYQFDGWYAFEDNDNGWGILIDSETEVSKSLDHQLYAKWLRGYYVNYAYESVEGSYVTEDSEMRYADIGTSITITASDITIPEGYTLNTYGLSNNIVTRDTTLEIYVGFTRKTYTITYDVDGDTSRKKSFKHGKQTSAYDIPPEKEGHNFLGWVDSDGNEYTFGEMPMSNVTVYASWEEIN